MAFLRLARRTPVPEWRFPGETIVFTFALTPPLFELGLPFCINNA
jgi:hypothetical protein